MADAKWGDAPTPAFGRDGGRVEDLIAYYANEGFEVAYRIEDEVGLIRTSSWPAVIFGTVVGGIGGGINPSPRRQRIWLHVDPEGHALVRLYARHHT